MVQDQWVLAGNGGNKSSNNESIVDAYQKREKVCMIVFRGNSASNTAPTGSVDLAGKLLSELPVGGRTPLSGAIQNNRNS